MAMSVFSASLEEFQRKVMTNQIFRDLEAGFRGVVGHTVARSEASSWRGSLPRLEAALRLAELRGDVHVTLEERIPYFSKRMDACLFGHDQEGSPYTVVVELKGWTDAEARDDVSVETFLGGAERIEPHPSAQVQGYHQHLVDYRRAFHSPGAPRAHVSTRTWRLGLQQTRAQPGRESMGAPAEWVKPDSAAPPRPGRPPRRNGK
jgi:hypothetical protein